MKGQFGNQVILRLISEGTYLKPSKNARILAILDCLAYNKGLSQYELGKKLSLSGAMVNQYLKQLQGEGLVEFLPVNGKSYHYILTEKGCDMRRSMFSEYSAEAIRLYSSVKNFVLEKLESLEEAGKRKLALFGAAETCEVVLSALKDTTFKVVVLVDNNKDKLGQIFHGHVITSPHILEQVDCDAVVITSFGNQEEIFEQIEPLSKNRGFEIVRF